MEAICWNKLKTVFEQALALPPEQHPSFLDRACGSDAALRAEAAALLAYYPSAQAYFDSLETSVYVPAPASAEKTAFRRNQNVSHYKVLETISEGPMSVVYKARDVQLDRLVALKFLPAYLNADDKAQARFLHEAKATSALDHPNIVTLYEMGKTEPVPGKWGEGRLFMAMAYYEGETLKTKIARGPLPVDDVLNFASQTTHGLAHAHRHGVIHRDIKPANLLVTDDGLVKMLDFGLARVAGIRLTKTKTMLGTVAYMSPEQAQAETLDHRTDLWSLGVVLYEMLTGQLPFDGDYEQAMVYSILHSDPAPLADLRNDIPPVLGAIIGKCLEKDPGRRYQTAAALHADLKRVRLGMDQNAVPPPRAQASSTTPPLELLSVL